VYHGISQEIIRKGFYFEKRLNYNSFDKISHGRQLISLLSDNNITNLYLVNIDVQADLLVRLTKVEYGQISANIILQDYSLEGETHFRDFRIDSLLMPDLIEGNIKIFYNGAQLVSQPWLIGVRTGYVSLYIPDTIQFEENKLTVKLEVNRFDYSDERFGQFIETTNLINAYYAFTQVLSDMLAVFEKQGLSRNESPSRLFLAWEEIQRVNNYIYHYQFYNRLNLEYEDPAGFLALYDRSIRLQRRATTLKNWIKSIPSSGIIDDKQKFCKGFADISMKYLNMAGDHQPYIATGFSEVARIITSEQVKDMLKEASRLYDVFNAVGMASTPQMIYNEFVSLADSALVKHKYVSSLDLLYNANLIPEWFETVKQSPEYENIYVQSIDGLMSAYLRIATVAYNQESYYMAEMYYQKAINVYRLHSDNLGGKRLASKAFLAFIREQTELSYKLIDDKDYFRAVELLSKAKEISEEQQLYDQQSKIDSAFRIGYTGIYDEKLDSIEHLIEENRQDDALKAMEQTSQFSEQKNEYLQNMNMLHFSLLAQALFNTYYKQGLSLMQGENSEEALFVFLKAKRINDNYLKKPYQELDSMIYYATVPVIKAIVKKAEFEVWANRLDKANDLLGQALNYQNKYDLHDNAEVIGAINGLKEKIKNRHCTSLSNEIFAIGKQAENRITLNKYIEAETVLEKGRKILNDYPNCDLEGEKINRLWNEYKDAFSYYNIVGNINKNIESKNYDRVIDLFLELDQHYKKDNIKRYGLEEPDLYGFVRSQKNHILTDAATSYFIRSGQYENAFNYLRLLKQQDVASKDTRKLQQEIGEGLSTLIKDKKFNDKNLEAVLGGNDKWYRYLQKAYSNKPSFFNNIFTGKK